MVSIGLQWRQALWECYHKGENTHKDDANIKELLGNYISIERPQDIGLPFNKKINTIKEYMENMQKGLYDIEGYPLKGQALHDYVNSWNDRDKIEIDRNSKQSFVYTYPERLLRQFTSTVTPKKYDKINSEDFFYINQFDVMLDRLINNIGSNRAVATLYNPGLDFEEEDIPCLNWLQATIRDDKLELHCMFRSNDLYGAWPSNMYLLTFLGLWLTEEINRDYPNNNITFNKIHYHSSSLHIYETDLDAVKKILEKGL